MPPPAPAEAAPVASVIAPLLPTAAAPVATATSPLVPLVPEVGVATKMEPLSATDEAPDEMLIAPPSAAALVEPAVSRTTAPAPL